MRGPTLPFAPTKTHDPISVDLREKFLYLLFSFLSRTLSFAAKMWPSLFDFPFFLPLSSFPFSLIILFFIFLFIYIAPCVHLSFGSISALKHYLFSVQFILNEVISSHFLISEIFVKISFLESLATYHLESRKTFRLSHNLTKFFWVTRFRETNLTAQTVSSFEI